MYDKGEISVASWVAAAVRARSRIIFSKSSLTSAQNPATNGMIPLHTNLVWACENTPGVSFAANSGMVPNKSPIKICLVPRITEMTILVIPDGRRVFEIKASRPDSGPRTERG